MIATLLALLTLTNKERLRSYWHTREDDALIGLDLATLDAAPGFAKVAVGYAPFQIICFACHVSFERLPLVGFCGRYLYARDHQCQYAISASVIEKLGERKRLDSLWRI